MISMLQRTFQHIPGIGPKTEKRIWSVGIQSWNDVMQHSCPECVTSAIWEKIQKGTTQVREAFVNRNTELLNKIIPSDLHWRMIPNYFGEIAYLDIETTGGMPPYHYITAISVYDGAIIHNFIKGQNLDQFPQFIRKFPAIATFFGKGFDIPFIQAEMGIKFPQVHFDICFLLRKVGLHGGLKRIEKHFGFDRKELDGIQGELAIILWKKYQETHDVRYLNTLVAYNSEDVVNLEFLLVHAYNALCQKYVVPFSPLEYVKKEIKRPYQADLNIVKEIKAFSTFLEDIHN
jgi:uncharacterized protein YprB with RNaseH-like and TPR domain